MMQPTMVLWLYWHIKSSKTALSLVCDQIVNKVLKMWKNMRKGWQYNIPTDANAS